MSVYIETFGQGEDLVLIHGWGIHGGIWQRTAEHLARHYCVHIVDLPGCGASDMVSPYTLANLANSLDAVFPLAVHVVGWSLGGAVGMQWALQAADKVRSLTLCASSPSFIQRPDWPYATSAETLSAFAAGLAGDYAATLNTFLGLQVMGSRDGRSVLRALQRGLAERPVPQLAALVAGLTILKETDLRSRLTELGCPLLLQYGDRDRMAPSQVGEWLARLSGAQLVMHTGAGHAPFISHEAAFVAAQLEFLGHH
ncbi:pimeloyl-ACP methyl ester esterase BioH [Chitinimonas sp. BJB300]|uniref:pimeloyl-ACP methyl ester esterase BioH n=1 Tax=Chitinimonas sp. BJB300 TaxID=1559339 RepID=UPI000C1208F1|nr:pimeloyl-ACP methyl ester esterase BioH [Chitinimonas sp. BJB300]PHV10323.1 pimeloyl-[acyl-carrier protein] methyl ester esterase [Chitinimonas sp. BJB300]TSJ91625.1 pimeloyl-ACP methyl ester esterase BioH [Chitinimonas sp. BJB300]